MKTRMILTAALATALLLPAGLQAGGPETFKTKCASCHGADGAGQTVMGKKMGLRDLGSAEVQKQTDAQLTAIVADGKGKMPAYGTKLSADEIKALVAHMRSLKK